MGLSRGPRAVSGVSATGHLLLPLIPHDPENSSVSFPPQRRQARVARPQALTPGSDPKGFLEMLAWKCLVMQGRFPSRRHMTIGPTWFLVCDPRSTTHPNSQWDKEKRKAWLERHGYLRGPSPIRGQRLKINAMKKAYPSEEDSHSHAPHPSKRGSLPALLLPSCSAFDVRVICTWKM